MEGVGCAILERRSKPPGEVTMKQLLIGAALLVIAGCTDPENARRILRDSGYTNIAMTGYNWGACSSEDTYHTGFVATSPSGYEVKGTVCAGPFYKNSTIRFE
jgi:hypothetical protein